MMKTKISLYSYCSIICILLSNVALSQLISPTNSDISSIKLTVLDHYSKLGQKMKYDAAVFLLDNIEPHKSKDLQWVDKQGNDTGFKELNYPNYISALDNFKILKDSIKIKPKHIEIKDTDQISAKFLIENIDSAFESWKNYPWAQSYSFETFCKKILPYRSVTEPLQDWRKEYSWFVQSIADRLGNSTNQLDVCQQIMDRAGEFEFVQVRKDPLPLLGPRQLLFREQGSCPDIANLMVYTGRSLGLAMSFDFTPHWAASSSRHMWCALEKSDGSNISFDISEFFTDNYNKRLGKVFRYTYEIQKNSMAAQVALDSIPDTFLRSKTILDVTEKYVDTQDVKYTFGNTNSKYTYLSVFNKTNWEIIDWATMDESGTSIFRKIGKNLVYLPLSGSKKIIAEPYPILVTKKDLVKILKPNKEHTFSCTLSRSNETASIHKDNNPLKILNNKKYSLFYWDKGWVNIGESVASNSSVEFHGVPENALFILAPETPSKFIRIFTINSLTDTITWY